MWNNYTVGMQNPGRMQERRAEAEANRLAAESHVGDKGAVRLTDVTQQALRSAVSQTADLWRSAAARARAARSGAAIAAQQVRHAHLPRARHIDLRP